MFKSFSPALQSVLIAVLAYASFSHGDVLTKFLTQTYTVPTCLAVGSLIGLVICSIWIYAAKGWRGFKPPLWRIHLLRAFIVSLSAYSAVNAIKLIPLPAFYSIIFLAPIAVIIVASLLGTEKFRPHRLITVLLGFAGVLVIVGVQYETLGWGAVYALVNVLCTSVSVQLIRRMGQHDYLPVYCFFPFVAIFLTTAPFATWSMPLPETADLLRFIGFGGLIMIGHICIPLAYAKAPQASLVAPVFYTQMFWGILYGYIFFNQMPTVSTLIGATMIISGGLYMIYKERRKTILTEL